MKTYSAWPLAAVAILFTNAAGLYTASAQTPADPAAGTSALAPPANHESGTIDQVLTANDGGYQMRSYIVTWRGSRVLVSGSPAAPLTSGANLEFTVYRSSVNGQRGLRFVVAPSGGDANVAQDESDNSQVSITSGTAKVQDVLAADDDGYSFVAYLVNWHDQRVAVVDPSLHTPKVAGDKIDFRVFHTGAPDNRQLSFALSP
jgi:hypothetical protein